VWSRFGSEVRRLRQQAGLSQDQLARSSNLSPSFISSIERGTRTPKRDHAETFDAVLNTSGSLTRLWVQLNNQDSYPDWFKRGVLLEKQAREIREYQSLLMPGLAQTLNYAQTVLRLGRPWDTPNEIARLAEARVKRQEILKQDDHPMLWAVIDESALRRPICTPEVMDEQLQHLLDLGEAHKLRLQIIPTESRNHPGLSGSFRLMTFREHPPVVYAEHTLGEELVDDAELVSQCNTLFGALQGEALSTSATIDLIHQIRGDLK
jgi:transcriptional regulator with XRE-family HTH domain